MAYSHEEIEQLLNKITQGSWRIEERNGSFQGVLASDYLVKTEYNHGTCSWSDVVACPAHGHSCDIHSDAAHNMLFIAASPTIVRQLLNSEQDLWDKINTLKDKLKIAIEALEFYADSWGIHHGNDERTNYIIMETLNKVSFKARQSLSKLRDEK